MARVVKEEEYAVRRNEILDAAQRLIFTKGYDQTSIQDILAAAQVSKGAFYHYFDSKQELLEALISRIQDEAEQVLCPILQDPELNALEKLHRYFATISNWKTERKAFLLSLLRVLYADANALMRQKMVRGVIRRFAPQLSTIIQQGMREGVLQPAYPDQAGEIALSLLQSQGDTLAELMLASEKEPTMFTQVESIVTAYTDALERVLGARAGSVHVIDTEMLKEWFV